MASEAASLWRGLQELRLIFQSLTLSHSVHKDKCPHRSQIKQGQERHHEYGEIINKLYYQQSMDKTGFFFFF